MASVLSQRHNRVVDRLLESQECRDPHATPGSPRQCAGVSLGVGAFASRMRPAPAGRLAPGFATAATTHPAAAAMLGCVGASALVTLLVAFSFSAELFGGSLAAAITGLMFGGLLCVLVVALLAYDDIASP